MTEHDEWANMFLPAGQWVLHRSAGRLRVMRRQPREPWRQLEQRSQEPPRCEPEQQHARQSQQQHWLPPLQLTTKVRCGASTEAPPAPVETSTHEPAPMTLRDRRVIGLIPIAGMSDIMGRTTRDACVVWARA